jgi:hypothetical protein
MARDVRDPSSTYVKVYLNDVTPALELNGQVPALAHPPSLAGFERVKQDLAVAVMTGGVAATFPASLVEQRCTVPRDDIDRMHAAVLESVVAGVGAERMGAARKSYGMLDLVHERLLLPLFGCRTGGQ